MHGRFGGSLGVAMLVSSLDLALGVVGGSSGMLIGFIFPAIFYERMRQRTGAHYATASDPHEPAAVDVGGLAAAGKLGTEPPAGATAFAFPRAPHEVGAGTPMATPYVLLSGAGHGPDVGPAGSDSGPATTARPDWRRAGARALVVGGTLLIPVLVGAQVIKAVGCS